MEVEKPGAKKVMIAILIIIILIASSMVFLYVYNTNDKFLSGGEATLAGSWSLNATSNTTGKIQFGVFTRDVYTRDLQIFIWMNESYSGYLLLSDYNEETSIETTWIKKPDNVNAEYVDL